MADSLDPADDEPRHSLESCQRLLQGKDDFEALVALSEGDPLGLDGAIRDWLPRH